MAIAQLKSVADTDWAHQWKLLLLWASNLPTLRGNAQMKSSHHVVPLESVISALVAIQSLLPRLREDSLVDLSKRRHQKNVWEVGRVDEGWPDKSMDC